MELSEETQREGTQSPELYCVTDQVFVCPILLPLPIQGAWPKHRTIYFNSLPSSEKSISAGSRERKNDASMALGQYFGGVELGFNAATLAPMVVSTLTYYLGWGWFEIARVRNMTKGGRTGSPTLPSSVPMLPRWLPLLGGHTLQLDAQRVSASI